MARLKRPASQSIDWTKPLEAVDRMSSDRSFRVEIDRSFALVSQGQFIKLPRNAWTGEPSGGTWLFSDTGYAIGGMGPDGYEGRYMLRNVCRG